MATKIGFVGAGNISDIYLRNITNLFKEIEVIGVCDLIRERAVKAAAKYAIPKIYDDMHALFADPDVDLVLNITRPYQHHEVTKAALLAGKPVYTEKPLAVDLTEADELLAIAKEKNLLLGNAPDTFLGAGIQGCRCLIEDDIIGEPIGAAAHMICHGHETWHTDPAFYYKRGGGPMMDMGPYYITALINLMGPVAGVMGMTKITYPTRTITAPPHCGEVINVDIPTYVTGLIRFKSGAVATIFTTFDAYSVPGVQPIEIYGTKGNMLVPDPNDFGGTISVKIGEKNSPDAADAIGHGDWISIDTPYEFYSGNSRALGLADMAKALQTGRKPRANAEQAYHVLEVLTAFQKSSESGREVAIQSTFELQPPMPIVSEEGVIA
ncbi:MAG: Gfo/Idh/MocA family oxidoreductase [Oscillospiraceae bacterium]|jgi:predicted dehydrogenase|nr:Gfo/Idh/MocA family oxidoreductase [Oscillospiraceae bacterium]